MPEYRLMTDDEKRAAAAIDPARVTYVPGSYDKRFGRDMATKAKQADARITEAQARLIWSKVIRYRRQIPYEVVALAQQRIAGTRPD